MVNDDTLRGCKTTADVKPYLRELFQAGAYEDVYDAIQRFCEFATINRSQIRQNLFQDLVPLTSNYVIPKRLGARDMLDWEQTFPDLLQRATGEEREETWRAFLLDRATFRRDGLRSAIERIVETLG